MGHQQGTHVQSQVGQADYEMRCEWKHQKVVSQTCEEANHAISDTEEAPEGMFGRGVYENESSFVDDDTGVRVQFKWSVDVYKR